MSALDPYLLVRASSLYLVVFLTLALVLWRRPSAREMAGAVFAALWNVPVLVALEVLADRAGWWRFDATGGLLLGVPVEMLLSWAWLWGALPALAFPRLPVPLVAGLVFAVDVLMMPFGGPVLVLGPNWIVGEIVGVVLGVVPGQLLARWTARDVRLVERATLQVLAFGGLVGFVVPLVAISATGGEWRDPRAMPGWQLSLCLHVLAIPAIAGLSAVQEFVTRGEGTPVPYDPPRRLVTSGLYAYIRNPMQLSGVLLLLLLGVVLGNLWISAAGVMAHVYSIGIAGWDEDEDLRRRFGDAWLTYRSAVPRWIPNVRPWHRPDRQDATLYVAESCEMCSAVARWFDVRGASGLKIVAAETHPSGNLTRIQYEPGGDEPTASGIDAVGRALEHLHVGWAFVGAAMRLPGVRWTLQLFVDASGGGPRRIDYSERVSRGVRGAKPLG